MTTEGKHGAVGFGSPDSESSSPPNSVSSQSAEKLPPEIIRELFHPCQKACSACGRIDHSRCASRVERNGTVRDCSCHCHQRRADLAARVSQSADAGEVAREAARRIRNLYRVASNTPDGELECSTADIIASALTTTRQQATAEIEALRKGNRDLRRIVTGWQQHCERMGKLLGCIGIDEAVEERAAALKAACNRALEDFEILITRGDLTEEPRAHQTRDLLRKVLGKAK